MHINAEIKILKYPFLRVNYFQIIFKKYLHQYIENIFSRLNVQIVQIKCIKYHTYDV